MIFCFGIFILSVFSYQTLLIIKNRGKHYLPVIVQKHFFLNALKSNSNALQMGGIPFAFLAIISITGLFVWFPYLLNSDQRHILKLASISWMGILLYGYLDDHYEIRPIVKLSFQLIIVSIFSLGSANTVFPENSALAFVIMSFFGVALLNGANLIDGLDTLSFKVSSVIYLGFIVLAAPIMNLPTLFIASACFFSLLGFYIYNRYPSKIHLGEIGGSCIGFSYFVLATLIFYGYRQFNPPLSALTKALIPCSLPIIELAVSFLRRIIKGKSPFKGDKLHVHHLLHDVFDLSVSLTATIVAGVYLLFMIFSFWLMDVYSSLMAFIILNLLILAWYLLIGYRRWFTGEITINLFEGLLVKKEVRIISSDTLAEFDIVIKRDDSQS